MDELLVQEEDYRGHHIRIYQDTEPESPREWDNFGHMLCFHRLYDLGDNPKTVTDTGFGGWEDVIKYLHEEHTACIILPLYLYDHSGLRMKVGSFQGLLPQGHAEFDTMQVGFTYVNRQEILDNFQRKHMAPKLLKRAEELLRLEVEVYDQYLRGDVYGYTVSHDVKCGECGHVENVHDDSCSGYYGAEKITEMIAECKTMIDSYIKEDPCKVCAHKPDNTIVCGGCVDHGNYLERGSEEHKDDEFEQRQLEDIATAHQD